MRLNKYVAHCGICSRRKAAEIVKKGLVKVNGVVEDNPAIIISDTDEVSYLGKIIKPVVDQVYLLLNKPKNVITTVSDERGRKTVIDMVKEKVNTKIFPIGRLDRNTTGLLLLTNDGELTMKLSHPSSEVKKIYQVTLDKEVPQSDLDKIIAGLDLEDGKTDVDAVSYVKDMDTNIVGIELHSGKNRIVRRIFEHLNYEVLKLDRVYYAGLTKKDLPRGWSRNLTEKEIIMLKHFTH